MSPDQKHLSLPIDVYARVSKVGGRDGDSYISPDVQRERATAKLASKGLTVGDYFLDEDQSGGKMNRPEFNKAMQRIRDEVSGGIAVHKLDRFARNTRGLLEAIEEIESYGAVFVCVEPEINTADPVYGKFILTLFAGIAEMELGKISRGWEQAHDKHVERGVPAARAPFGYEKDDDGRLIPDPAGRYVTEVFQRRADGQPLAAIAEWLNEESVPKKWSDTAWIDSNVQHMLANRKYLGEIRYGERVNATAHKPLIDTRTFDLARAKGRNGVVKETKGDHLFSGFVRCSHCGMRMARSKAGETAAGTPYYQWRCKYQPCRKSSISDKALQSYLIGYLAKEAVFRFAEPEERDDERVEQAQQAILEAEADLGAFLAVARATDPGYATAVKIKRQVIEEAKAELARIPRAAPVGWKEQVRKTYEEWNEFFGREVVDPGQAVEEVGKQFTDGISGAFLVELFVEGGESARVVVKQILKQVEVTGKNPVPGSDETPTSVATRVVVELV